MAFNVVFYNRFEKRTNSTKRPSSEDGLNYSCELKDNCSIIEPTITIKRPTGDWNPHILNYAYIDNFDRYYFVENWSWDNGIWTAHLKVDVLATYKNYIGNTETYINRASASVEGSFFDGAVMDTYYPSSTNLSVESKFFSNPWVSTIENGCYVVGIISGDSRDTVGAISYYALNNTQFSAFKSYLFSDDFLAVLHPETLTEMSEELFKANYNPFQYIVSCLWFPIPLSLIQGTGVAIKIGWWTSTVLGKHIDNIVHTEIGSTEVPIHPQASDRGKYLCYFPHTRLEFFDPPFGQMPLDTSYYEVGDRLYRIIDVDLVTGEATSRLFFANVNDIFADYKPILTKKAMVGVQIQLAQVAIDYISTAPILVNTANSMVSGAVSGALQGMATSGGNLLAGAVSGVFGGITNGLSGIASAINTAMPQVMTAGSNGSFSEYLTLNHQLVAQHFILVEENLDHKGRPLCQNRTISDFSGYLECADGETDAPCYDEEKAMINAYLVNGFFYE